MSALRLLLFSFIRAALCHFQVGRDLVAHVARVTSFALLRARSSSPIVKVTTSPDAGSTSPLKSLMWKKQACCCRQKA
jgi:hypothetical protein